jgi:hypothetical protein
MTEKFDKYLPVAVPDTKVEKAEKPYSPTDFLEPKQIKYAEIKVMASSLSDEQIAQRLGVEMARIKQWSRNKHLKALINDLKRKLVDQDLIEKVKKQTEELLDLTYVEAKTRFDNPFSDENQKIYNNLEESHAKEAFYQRFAYFAAHDKQIRTFNELSKSMRLAMPENVEQLQEVQLKEMMVSFRNNYEEGRMRRLEMEKASREGKEVKLSPYSFKKSNSKSNKNSEVIDIDDAEIESLSIKTVSIKRSRDGEEESED